MRKLYSADIEVAARQVRTGGPVPPGINHAELRERLAEDGAVWPPLESQTYAPSTSESPGADSGGLWFFGVIGLVALVAYIEDSFTSRPAQERLQMELRASAESARAEQARKQQQQATAAAARAPFASLAIQYVDANLYWKRVSPKGERSIRVDYSPAILQLAALSIELDRGTAFDRYIAQSAESWTSEFGVLIQTESGKFADYNYKGWRDELVRRAILRTKLLIRELQADPRHAALAAQERFARIPRMDDLDTALANADIAAGHKPVP